MSLSPYRIPRHDSLPVVVSMLPALRMAEKSLRFPASSQSSPESAEAASSVNLKGKRAVVVEDEGVTQLQLRRILISEGVEVVGVASNGKEAVDLVRDQNPDFVLMDIRMPVMDGLEATRRILEDHPVCIVMLTAFSDAEYQLEAAAIGTCGYVLKPVTSDTLIPQVRSALQTYKARRGNTNVRRTQ